MANKKFFDITPPKPPIVFSEEKNQFFPNRTTRQIFSDKKSGRRTGKKVIGILIFLIFVFVFFHFFLTKAEIKIQPETENLNFQEKVMISIKTEQINFFKKIIPGKIFEEEKSVSQEFPSSGKILKEEKARGQIRVYNKYHLSQTLVANTRFQPPLEKVLYFRSTKAIVVPAKGYIDIEVTADRPGEEYNIGPSDFSVPGLQGLPQYYDVYGKSFSPMTGGFRGEINQVVEKDLKDAKNTLLEKIKKESETYIKQNFSEDFILLNEVVSQEIIEESSNFPAGGVANFFNFNLKTKLRAILFKGSDLENFSKDIINLNIQGTEKRIIQESLKINYLFESINWEKGEIVLNLEISAKIYTNIDLEGLKKNISGKTLREVKLLLEDQPQIIDVQLKTFPFWIKKIPKEEKIKIELNFQ